MGYPFPFEYDESRASDNASNQLKHPGWDNADNWKIKRKSRVRMKTPKPDDGITIEIDNKNQVIRAWYKNRVIREITFEQAKNNRKN